MKVQFLFLILIVLSASKCDKNEINQEKVCYHFDERQCNTDPFNEGNPDRSQLIGSIKSWLQTKGIDVDTVTVNPDFHEAVCEACHVCPLGPRYFISFPESQSEIFEVLGLLNWGKDECVN